MSISFYVYSVYHVLLSRGAPLTMLGTGGPNHLGELRAGDQGIHSHPRSKQLTVDVQIVGLEKGIWLNKKDHSQSDQIHNLGGIHITHIRPLIAYIHKHMFFGWKLFIRCCLASLAMHQFLKNILINRFIIGHFYPFLRSKENLIFDRGSSIEKNSSWVTPDHCGELWTRSGSRSE